MGMELRYCIVVDGASIKVTTDDFKKAVQAAPIGSYVTATVCLDSSKTDLEGLYKQLQVLFPNITK